MLPFIDPISSRRGFAIVSVGAIALVALSLILTEWLDLSPCPLCIFQRMLYLLLASLALVGAVWPKSLRWSGGAALLTSCGGFITAVYQSWLQASAADSNACEYQDPNLIEQVVIWAGERLPSLFYAWGDCSSTEQQLFGVSIANWSAMAFLLFSILLVMLIRRGVR